MSASPGWYVDVHSILDLKCALVLCVADLKAQCLISWLNQYMLSCVWSFRLSASNKVPTYQTDSGVQLLLPVKFTSDELNRENIGTMN